MYSKWTPSIIWFTNNLDEKKERGEIDGQLRTWEMGSIYYSIKIYVLNWAKKKKKKLKESYYKIIKVQQFLAYFTKKWIIKSQNSKDKERRWSQLTNCSSCFDAGFIKKLDYEEVVLNWVSLVEYYTYNNN